MRAKDRSAVATPVMASDTRTDHARYTAAIGRMLCVARQRAGLTCSAATEALGPDGADVAAIERGETTPTLPQLYALADMYGARIEVYVWPRTPVPVSPNR